MERTGLEPVTPCLQSIYEEGECAQLAHSWGRDAHIFVHRHANVCILRGNVSVIVSVLGATQYLKRHQLRIPHVSAPHCISSGYPNQQEGPDVTREMRAGRFPYRPLLRRPFQ